MKNLRNSIIKMSMESISDIMDHQTLASQLVDETSELMGGHTVDGGGSPSPVTVLSAHDDLVDDQDITHAHTVVSTGDGSVADVRGGSVVMVRTIIDGCPVQSSYLTTQHHSLSQQQLPHHHHHHHSQSVQSQPSLAQIANGNHHHHHQLHQHQQQRQSQQQDQLQRLRSSPVDFVGSDVTLDALSVGSSSNSTTAHIIAVKQEHKLVIVNNNNNNNSNNNNNNSNNNNNNSNGNGSICVGVGDNHTHSTRGLDVSSVTVGVGLGVGVGVGVMDDLSSDAVEVTLNQHHHQHAQQQQLLQQHQQHYGQSQHSSHHHSHSHSHVLDSHHHSQHQQHSHSHSHHQRHSHHHQTQGHTGHGGGHHHHHHHSPHHEALSVIVQPHDDSRDSATQILSPELGVVGVVGDNSLEPTTYQTLTSVNERMSPPGFSPTSSYATLTPLQPLPPISTMSDKFAYGGHISGGGGVTGGGTGSNSNSSSGGVGPFAVMPHQGSLGGLSLSSLSGVQSPYSSYDKLPSMGMSMSPPHNYASSPSHTLSGMVVTCDLHPASPSPCGALSPQSAYSHSTELHSPPLAGCKAGGSGDALQSHQNGSKQVVCLSPAHLDNGGLVGDNVVVTGYESPYGAHQRDLMVTTTPSSTSTSGGRNSHVHLQHSPTLSPHSVSAGSVSLHSPGGCSIVGQSVVTLPPINGAMATLSAASLGSASGGLVEIAPLQRDAVVLSLTPSPPPAEVGDSTTLLATHQPQLQMEQQQQQHQHQQHSNATSLIGARSSAHQEQLLPLSGKPHPVTSDCNLNLNLTLSSNGLRLTGAGAGNNISNNNNQNSMCNINQQQQQQLLGSAGGQATSAAANNGSSNSSAPAGGGGGGDLEEINTKELAQRISAELKRYSIPQAIFAQRVLCRSQGTLSDLLRNPKPWSKLKSGRETFRRMFKWLQEPEFQRMSALRMAAAQIPQRGGGSGGVGSSVGVGAGGSVIGGGGAGSGSDGVGSGSGVSGVGGTSINGSGSVNSSVELKPPPHSSLVGAGVVGVVTACRRKDEPHIEHMPQPKKPRLVFTDLQRRTLQAIFKETKRPSKEMQVTIARQLGLEPTTVGNFFMNARRRSMDKWRDDDSKNMGGGHHHHHHHHGSVGGSGGGAHSHSNNSHHHRASLSPGNQHSLDLDDDPDMDLDLGHDDFDLDGEHDADHDNDELL